MKNQVLLAGLLISTASAGEVPVPIVESGAKDDLSAKDIIVPAARTSKGYWKAGAGIVLRRIGGTNINQGAQASGFSGLPLGVGNADAIDNREYDDGFVRVGTGTELSGFTSYFGYPTAPSFSAGDLVFTRSGGVDIQLPSSGRDSDETAASPYIQLSYLTPIRENMELGFGVNFSLAGLDSNINQNLAVNSVTTRDTFDIGDVIVPNKPFTGSVAVALGGSPLIPNRPTNREQVSTPNGSFESRFESDTDLFSLALGPELHWFPSEKTSIGVSGGLVINFADWDASATLPSVTATNQIVADTVRNSGEEFLFGAFIKANVETQLTEEWGLETFFRYDWSEDLEGRVGDTTYNTDLSGWSAGVGLTYSF